MAFTNFIDDSQSPDLNTSHFSTGFAAGETIVAADVNAPLRQSNLIAVALMNCLGITNLNLNSALTAVEAAIGDKLKLYKHHIYTYMLFNQGRCCMCFEILSNSANAISASYNDTSNLLTAMGSSIFTANGYVYTGNPTLTGPYNIISVQSNGQNLVICYITGDENAPGTLTMYETAVSDINATGFTFIDTVEEISLV